MTLTLILIRHAKSDWDHPDLDDHDRPLNERGERSAPRIGAWLARNEFLPRHVLCSTALRTRQTWEGIAAHLPDPPAPAFSRRLYLATPAAMQEAIGECDAASLAVIGHNPGIGMLAASLCRTAPDHPGFDVYPTGATLVLQFDADRWDGIEPGAGNALAFAVPRELPDPA